MVDAKAVAPDASFHIVGCFARRSFMIFPSYYYYGESILELINRCKAAPLPQNRISHTFHVTG